MPIGEEAITGRVWIEDGLVKNRSTYFGDWEIPLGDLRLVGESTNENGPFVDDWMLIFITGPDGWREASFYATIDTDFRERLGAALGSPLAETGLANSASFKSRILWPPELVGRPVFHYEPARPKTWIGRLAARFIGPWSCTQRFTDEVVAYL